MPVSTTLRRLMRGLALSFLLAAAIVPPVAVASEDAPRILVYGDSISWGFVPAGAEPAPVKRYPKAQRWTGVLQAELGQKYTVVEEALNARTAGLDGFRSDVYEGVRNDLNLNGRPTLLPILRSHEPLALVVLFLGTNDTRPVYKQTVEQITASVARLVEISKQGLTEPPRVLLIAPPPGQKGQSPAFNAAFADSYGLARQLGPAFQALAERENIGFFDAASVIPVADGSDGIHLTVESNRQLGLAVAAKVRELLEKK